MHMIRLNFLNGIAIIKYQIYSLEHKENKIELFPLDEIYGYKNKS